MRTQVQFLASLSGLRISVAMRCGVGGRCGSDPPLLWLWCRPAATALIQPLAWEPPYAADVALKSTPPNKNKNKTLKNSYMYPCHKILSSRLKPDGQVY